MKKNKKTKKQLKRFGDSKAQFAYDWMSLKNTRLQLAIELNRTLDEINAIMVHSEDFRTAVELCEQRNKSRDLEYIRDNADNKDFKVQVMRDYMFWTYGMVNTPTESPIDTEEDFGFDITIRPKK